MAGKADERPPVWIGHVFIAAVDVSASARFYEQIGMRPVAVNERFAALEMRGGTHLAIRYDPDQARADSAPWDLMVEDLDATHDQWHTRGLPVGDIVDDKGAPHRRFEVTDPDGHRVVVRDSHVVGPV